ncbi:MAG: type I glyceraldehyde-3-phosphate dehydrogenase [Candidatus Marsarchaeota archaeon]|nr:type I glyceraldehyde-3-phosphate dehydrogenase [Candidatus Marsarchaeota archaeon]
MIKVAINGFGRIGRLFFRIAMQNEEFKSKFQIVAINDLTDAKTLAHLLKYDSNFGTLKDNITNSETTLAFNGTEIKILAVKDPLQLTWKEYGVDLVIESSGLFTERNEALKHVTAGAKKVLITAPAKNPDATIIMGVNQEKYNNSMQIVSMASCTTNSIAPPLKVIMDEFKIIKGFLTTAHAYTNDQRILDLPHKDLRRARAAAINTIPTSTGAAKAIYEVIPELKGRMDGIALRVPVSVGSISDLTLQLEKQATKEQINESLKKASETKMKGVMKYSEEELVSSDIKGESHTSIIDGKLTNAIGDMAKIFSWYDNEYGYSTKLVELANYMYK